MANLEVANFEVFNFNVQHFFVFMDPVKPLKECNVVLISSMCTLVTHLLYLSVFR